MTKRKYNKTVIFALLIGFFVALIFLSVNTFGNNDKAFADGSETYHLFSGKQTEVSITEPDFYASENARARMKRYKEQGIISENTYAVKADGYLDLRAFEGYWYGAANITFSNPIKRASSVKKISITLTINMYAESDYVIYINEYGQEGAVPYFRLYPVNKDGTVVTSRYFSFNDNNSKLYETFTMELLAPDIALLIDDNDEIETLQWSCLHTHDVSDGFADFVITDISYEYYNQNDLHSVTYCVNGKPVYFESTYFYANPPDLKKAGYSAVWLTADGKVFDLSEPVASDVELTLSWKGNDCTVKFQSNGGSMVNPIVAVAGEKVILPDNPTKEGYVFAGWYLDSTLATPFDENHYVSQNTVLYAKWSEKEIQIQDQGTENQSESSSCSSYIGFGAIEAAVICAFALIILKTARRRLKHE